MNSPRCDCCDEPLFLGGNALSRHPGVCPSCSSLLDGMEFFIPQTFNHAESGVSAQSALVAVSDVGRAERYGDWGINE
jgi:hypothetical protein